MFVVNDVLVSDDVAGAHFACALSSCLGTCCVVGDSGAPLEEDEIEIVEGLVPRVSEWLSPAAHDVIRKNGAVTRNHLGEPSISCVEDKECVFVYYENDIAKCAIQKLHIEADTDFPKPVSCHLYPLRIDNYGGHEVINYEQLEICCSGRLGGEDSGTELAAFLKEPLVRKYGVQWYDKFCFEIDRRKRHVQ